ncbi:MAG TPA: hypothetical protein VLV49_11570 [Terriglobales bacterium]|nr:hypothetical protein [Terriglobales bacterium]
MSVASIASSSLAQLSNQSLFQQRRTDFQQLAQSLQSGDLAGAQQAFSALASLISSSQNPNSSSAGQNNSQLAQDFNAIGQALQNGDLAGAQQAFAAFKQDLQALRGGRFQGNAAGQSNANPAIPEVVLNLGNASTAGPEQITLDFSNGSSGEQLNLSVSNGSTAPPERIAIQLGNTLPQIILNFGASGSTSSAGSPSGTQLNVTA